MRITFDLYDCFVRPGGNLLHEVPVTGITNRELALLKDIHGPQGVHNLRKTGTVERDDRLEYFRIIEKYGSHDDAEATARMKQRVERVFKVSLEDFDGWLAGKMEDASDDRQSRHDARVAEAEALTAEARQRFEAETRARVTAELREQIRKEERERALEELTSPKPAVAESIPAPS